MGVGRKWTLWHSAVSLIPTHHLLLIVFLTLMQDVNSCPSIWGTFFSENVDSMLPKYTQNPSRHKSSMLLLTSQSISLSFHWAAMDQSKWQWVLSLGHTFESFFDSFSPFTSLSSTNPLSIFLSDIQTEAGESSAEYTWKPPSFHRYPFPYFPCGRGAVCASGGGFWGHLTFWNGSVSTVFLGKLATCTSPS